MSDLDEHQDSADGDPPRRRACSRGAVLVGAGVGGGRGVAAALGSRQDGGGRRPAGTVGTGPRGSTVVEFRGRIDADGHHRRVVHQLRLPDAGATAHDADDLFDGGPHNESTALLTAFATRRARSPGSWTSPCTPWTSTAR